MSEKQIAYLRCTVETIPDYEGEEWIKWCEAQAPRYCITPLGSSRRAWFDEASTYFRSSKYIVCLEAYEEYPMVMTEHEFSSLNKLEV